MPQSVSTGTDTSGDDGSGERQSREGLAVKARTAGSPASDWSAGRTAAERLAHSWPDRSWVTDAPSPAWARGAIERFGELLREQPAIFRASREGSERGAESLSPRPYQGILESLQNADDVRASALRMRVVRGATSELLLGHDGDPVDLGHAGAMLLPWLTTKEDEAEASGRFGIGQQTLRSLGGPIEVHCPPYHFRLASDGPGWVEPAADVEGVYSAAARNTLNRVPLEFGTDVDQLIDFVVKLGARSLLFLKHVRLLTLAEGGRVDRVVRHEVVVEGQQRLTFRIREHQAPGEWTRLCDPSTGRTYHRYVADVPIARSERRRHKALGPTTAVGVAIPCQAGEVGGIYDRLPLPIPSAFPFSLNAQFDPDAARSTILELPWNERRLEDLGDMVAAGTIECFSRDPVSAWRGVPLQEETADGIGGWLTDRVRTAIIARAQDQLAAELNIATPHGSRPLDALTYEAEELDSVVTAADLELLCPDRTAVPVEVRDGAARWRTVLSELGRSHELGVGKALALFDLDDGGLGARDPAWFVGMARAAVDADVIGDFLSKRSILLADGRRIQPPASGVPRTLVARLTAGSVGAILGIALPLNPAYVDQSTDAQIVQAALREAVVLLDEVDSPGAAFEVLARDREASTIDPVRLNDNQLLALRDAFETMDADRQGELGPKVGKNIQLTGYVFTTGGSREERWVRPVDAYLPTVIDRETGSFARSAASTLGLCWVHARYARILKRAGGRRELGAQRFLVKLGAATQPRLIRPTNESAPYARDPRAASAVSGVSRPSIQLREIRALVPTRTHLLEDRWSPDLDVVIANISDDRSAKRRRARGLALLRVLSRAWERHYADHQSAQAVHRSYGWEGRGEVLATWLARAAETAWLPSASGRTRAPIELSLPTEANRLAYGTDRNAFLADLDDTILRGPAVQALRIRRGPAVSSLVERLRELAEAVPSPEAADEARGIYQLVALAVPAEGRAEPIDDMSVAELRAAFAPSPRGRGLLLAGDRWYGPQEVLSGPHIFGSYRPFVPHSPTLRSLWRLLGIREPTATDCIAVLRELADAPLEMHDVGVILETTRTLAGLLAQITPQLRTQVGRLPLWTARGWIRTRPVYAIEDIALASEIGDQVPVWEHGFGSLLQLEDLLNALKVTVVRREDFRPAALMARDRVEGDRIRPSFFLAAEHLRDELAKGDPTLHSAITVPWQELVTADVFVDADLALTWTAPTGTAISVKANAHMMRDPLALIVRSASLAGVAEAAGAAVASLFAGDRQKVAWAWASMWQRAEAGLASAGVILSDHGVDADDGGTARLLRLKGQASDRRGRGDRSRGRAAGGMATAAAGAVVVRTLKDVSQFEPDDGTVVNRGRSKAGVILPTSGAITRPEPAADKPGDTGAGQGDGPSDGRAMGDGAPAGVPTSPPRRRTVLPPMTEREQRAFDAVQAALALNPPEIDDLRARRGIGADAMDDLRQLYEIKMASGELSNEITLTRAEAEAAQDPDFFLALVAGLEDRDVPLSVRFIFDPLRRLALRITGEVTLSGLREVEALEYRFRKPEAPTKS